MREKWIIDLSPFGTLKIPLAPFKKGVEIVVPLFGKERLGEIFGKSKANLKSPSVPLFQRGRKTNY